MAFTISRAAPPDAAIIAANNCAMAEETEGKALDPQTVRRGVERGLAHPGVFYLLARREGEVVGQLMITTEWSDWRDGVFWWIQSVYVAPSARRQGVYRALYERVLGDARADGGVCGVRLYVHHDNAVAQRTYASLGMARGHYELYEVDFVFADAGAADR